MQAQALAVARCDLLGAGSVANAGSQAAARVRPRPTAFESTAPAMCQDALMDAESGVGELPVTLTYDSMTKAQKLEFDRRQGIWRAA